MTKNATKIKTLSGFIEWASQFNEGQYLFRGVSNKAYEIEASTYRRLPEENKKPFQLLNINKELLENARRLGHDQRNGRQLRDLELLTELQHYGAATCLIDFSRNTLIALWFACKKSDGNKRKGNNGKVSAIHYDDISVFKTVDTKKAEEDIDSFFKQKENGDYPLYLWQPKHQNNRVIAQHSMFIFGGAEISIDKKCIIQANDKPEILNALEKLFNISEETMFPDFDGFARLNAHNKTWPEPDTEDHKKRAFEFYQKGEYDNAIAAYTKAIEHETDYAGSYNNRGFLYAEKGEHDRAIEDYDEAIEFNSKYATAYYNRGFSYVEKGEHGAAIADYGKVIALNSNFAGAYNNRGFSYAEKGKYDCAIADYGKAIELNPKYTEPYYNRGGTYHEKGEYDCAIADYDKAIELNLNKPTYHLRRGLTHLIQKNWQQGKVDLMTAKEKGADIADLFHSVFPDINAFQQQYNIQLPADIVALLTPE